MNHQHQYAITKGIKCLQFWHVFQAPNSRQGGATQHGRWWLSNVTGDDSRSQSRAGWGSRARGGKPIRGLGVMTLSSLICWDSAPPPWAAGPSNHSTTTERQQTEARNIYLESARRLSQRNTHSPLRTVWEQAADICLLNDNEHRTRFHSDCLATSYHAQQTHGQNKIKNLSLFCRNVDGHIYCQKVEICEYPTHSSLWC